MQIKFVDTGNPNIKLYKAISSTGVAGKIWFAKLDNDSVVISKITGFDFIPADAKKTLEALVLADYNTRFPARQTVETMSETELAELTRRNDVCDTFYNGVYDNE